MTDPVADRAGELAARLHERGLRLTAQRRLILAAVEELRHATPDEVLAHVQEANPSLNASTVYRALEVLQDLGLVRHTHLSDRAPTYHAVSGPEHFHLVCRNCRRVRSVEPDVAAAFTAALLDRHRFDVDLGHLAVFGRCVDCDAAPPSHEHPHPHDHPHDQSHLEDDRP